MGELLESPCLSWEEFTRYAGAVHIPVPNLHMNKKRPGCLTTDHLIMVSGQWTSDLKAIALFARFASSSSLFWPYDLQPPFWVTFLF